MAGSYHHSNYNYNSRKYGKRSQEFFSMESVGYLNSVTFTQLRFYRLCQEYSSKTYNIFIY